MKDRNEQARQLWGCGYAPPPDEKLSRHVMPWDHVGRARDKSEPLVCVGYACSLPEVVEASHAAAFKRDGELTQWCGGDVATPALIDAITVFEIECSRVESWVAKNPESK